MKRYALAAISNFAARAFFTALTSNRCILGLVTRYGMIRWATQLSTVRGLTLSTFASSLFFTKAGSRFASFML